MDNRFERFRDFIYDYSDIFITLIIIVSALVLITWRTNIVLDYSAGDATQANAGTQVEQPAENGSGEGNGAELSAEPEDPDGTEGGDTSGIESTMSPDGTVFTVTIPAGATTQSIARILLQSGLITDTQYFLDAVAASGAESSLKAGTFTIPVGSSYEDIVTILTQ